MSICRPKQVPRCEWGWFQLAFAPTSSRSIPRRRWLPRLASSPGLRSKRRHCSSANSSVWDITRRVHPGSPPPSDPCDHRRPSPSRHRPAIHAAESCRERPDSLSPWHCPRATRAQDRLASRTEPHVDPLASRREMRAQVSRRLTAATQLAHPVRPPKKSSRGSPSAFQPESLPSLGSVHSGTSRRCDQPHETHSHRGASNSRAYLGPWCARASCEADEVGRLLTAMF